VKWLSRPYTRVDEGAWAGRDLDRHHPARCRGVRLGTIQHEYAHQVDFFLLTDVQRERLNALLGGKIWAHDETKAACMGVTTPLSARSGSHPRWRGPTGSRTATR
jgi:hypothetical protein